MWRYNSETCICELFCHWYCWLSSYMQDGTAGAVNTNCTCENKLAQIGPKSQHACFFFNEGKRRRKLNVFSEILNIQAPLFWSERMTILFCNMLRTLNMTNTGKWYKFYGMLVSDKYFLKLFWTMNMWKWRTQIQLEILMAFHENKRKLQTGHVSVLTLKAPPSWELDC